MIIKVSRTSRTKKILETYVFVPDSYSFRSAIKHIQATKGILTNKRVTFERVFDERNITKQIKHFDRKDSVYKVPQPITCWKTITRKIDELFDRSIEDYTILHKPHQVTVTEPLKVYQ